MATGKVLKTTNIRSAANQFSNDMGDLLAGDVVAWSGKTLGTDGLWWLKLTSATRAGQPVLCTDGNPVLGRYCWANNVQEEIAPPVATLRHTVKIFSDGSIQVDDGAVIV